MVVFRERKLARYIVLVILVGFVGVVFLGEILGRCIYDLLGG